MYRAEESKGRVEGEEGLEEEELEEKKRRRRRGSGIRMRRAVGYVKHHSCTSFT